QWHRCRRGVPPAVAYDQHIAGTAFFPPLISYCLTPSFLKEYVSHPIGCSTYPANACVFSANKPIPSLYFHLCTISGNGKSIHFAIYMRFKKTVSWAVPAIDNLSLNGREWPVPLDSL